jgi:hypothetical protein
MLIFLAAVCLVACGSESSTSAPQSGDSGKTAASSEVPLLSGHAQESDTGTGETTVRAGKMRFDLPADWQREAPRGGMRLAQAQIPGTAGLGELAVFFFGEGQGGGLEANLQRWLGQVEPDPGSEPQRQSFEVGDFHVVWIDVFGTLKASGFGMGPSVDQPGSRLFGAVVEGPGGPWFFKATGPDATLDAAREDFVAMVRSVRSE